MTFTYASKLGLTIKQTNVRVQKIDILLLKLYKIVIAGLKL